MIETGVTPQEALELVWAIDRIQDAAYMGSGSAAAVKAAIRQHDKALQIMREHFKLLSSTQGPGRLMPP